MASTRTDIPALYPLAAIRLGIGASAWLAPGVVCRLLRLGPGGRYPARLWGARNVALAAALSSRDRSVSDAAVRAGIAIDAADLVAGVVSARRAPRVLTIAFPLAAAALGAESLREARATAADG